MVEGRTIIGEKDKFMVGVLVEAGLMREKGFQIWI
jgi:hypothetical protein